MLLGSFEAETAPKHPQGFNDIIGVDILDLWFNICIQMTADGLKPTGMGSLPLWTSIPYAIIQKWVERQLSIQVAENYIYKNLKSHYPNGNVDIRTVL